MKKHVRLLPQAQEQLGIIKRLVRRMESGTGMPFLLALLEPGEEPGTGRVRVISLNLRKPLGDKVIEAAKAVIMQHEDALEKEKSNVTTPAQRS